MVFRKRCCRKDDPEYTAWLNRIDNTPTEELVVYLEGQAIQKWIAAREEAEAAGYSSVKEYDTAMNKLPAVPMIISAVEAAFLLGYLNVDAYNADVCSEAVAHDQARLARLEKDAALATRFQIRASTHGRNLRSSAKMPVPSNSSVLPDILSHGSLKMSSGPNVYSHTKARSSSEGLQSDISSEYDVLPTACSLSPAVHTSPHPLLPEFLLMLSLQFRTRFRLFVFS
ncbi:hypothetical protein C8R43DRAFT_1116182 [Mycena crocata]|nr:hypothetical protein C8R43DRAFT_1116182 [Mycena crocata]